MKNFLALVFFVLASNRIVFAQDEVRHWDMPTAYDGFHTENAVHFADCVRERTDGGIDITVRGDGEMFRGSKILAAVQSGEVKIGERLLSANSHEHQVFSIDSIPFLATSYEASEKLALAAAPAIRATLEDENLHLLYSVPWPGQGLHLMKQVDTLSDLKGIKIYAYNDRIFRIAELTGMQPAKVDVAEISQNIAIGIYEGLISSAKNVSERHLWKHGISHYYKVDAWLSRNSVVVNLETWRDLKDEERTVLTTCGEIASERGTRLSREQEEFHLSILRENGVVVERPDDATMVDFIETVGKPMIAEWLKTADESSAEALHSFLQGTVGK